MAILRLAINFERLEDVGSPLNATANRANAVELIRRMLLESPMGTKISYLCSLGFDEIDAVAVAALVTTYREPDYNLIVAYDRDIVYRQLSFVFEFRKHPGHVIVESDTANGETRSRVLSPLEFEREVERLFTTGVEGRLTATPTQIAPKPDPPKEPPKRRLRF